MMKNDVYKDMVEHLENEYGLSRKLKQVPNIFLDHSDRTDDDKKTTERRLFEAAAICLGQYALDCGRCCQRNTHCGPAFTPAVWHCGRRGWKRKRRFQKETNQCI